ncbi:MAG: hypothetical protein K2N94_05535 [Lachnospiraceae bacterium]|nr:hypothetical protein [Lachnospiraceae bacterium]
MEGVHKKGLNAELIGNDLEDCCKGEALCGQCQNASCTIGFAKECIQNYKKAPQKEVPDGTNRIPTMDFKVFDETKLGTAIAHILKECKNCKEDHTENCIINVIRNCYEVSMLGDVQPYEGSSLQYLMYLRTHFPEKAAYIADVYAGLPQDTAG